VLSIPIFSLFVSNLFLFFDICLLPTATTN
jgi:hypothetical protein